MNKIDTAVHRLASLLQSLRRFTFPRVAAPPRQLEFF
jgi:hypothetical protein